MKNRDAPFAWRVRRIHPKFTSRQICATLENAISIFGQ
jgi:hypothetical protein